jgi:outer membrane protein assembly factor BamB
MCMIRRKRAQDSRRIMIGAVLCLSFGLAPAPVARAADWPTSRGNPNHTGNLDEQPGPSAPKVRWVYKAPENFIASPVPSGKALYASGLGAFNTAAFHALALDPAAADRALWSKTAPFIKLPTVSAPAVVDGLVVFGDGMHQTDGATLYCLRADTGRPVWQYELPGKLVHLEGAPTIDAGRVFIGGGDAGVVCVDPKSMTLDGKPVDLAGVQKLMDERWAALQAQYEKDKAKDGDLAIPPSEEALPKPSPKLLWQQGKGKWHVDAAVDVTGGRVLAASAFIDADKVGKRVLACLKASDGSVTWETPLKLNPWAGPTVAGDLVLVGCSSIRFDKKDIKGASGEVVAINLSDGSIKWRKDIPTGGILGPIAVKDGLAVFTATDGNVRAFDAVTGAEKWTYAGGEPFFAGVAIAGGSVYAADLKGAVHALKLADGRRQWTLDLPADPAIATPGMVFGAPVVHGGELFLATNNLEGDSNDTPSVVVCLSDKAPAAGAGQGGGAIAIDPARRTITVPCRVAPRKLPTLKEIYPLEVVACYPHPQGQKAHETVVVIDARPSDIHKALEQLGLKPGTPARGEGQAASGPEVGLYLALPGIVSDQPRLVPIERLMVDKRTSKPVPSFKWIFTGSVLRQPDPDKPAKAYAADLTGTLISIFPVTDETVFQSNLTMKEEPLLKLETNKNLLPEEGTPLQLVIQVK